MMRVRFGVTRMVVLTRRWAIKVPSLRSHGEGARGRLWSLARGISANLSELEWSAEEGNCPVRWSLAGLVSVYPRCEPVPDGVEIDYAAIRVIPGPMDRKPGNVGLLDGRLVWVDYDSSWNDAPPCRERRAVEDWDET